MSYFDNYGKMALSDLPDVIQNGRYMIQQGAEKRIVLDLIHKLKPRPEDVFLDIGCGLGANLIPFSSMVSKAVGCDHPNVIKKFKEKASIHSIELYAGNFLDLDFSEQYTRILSYSVLPFLPDEAVFYKFIEKALELLRPDGIMLLGDLVNADKKRRFIKSARGREFQKKWDAEISNESNFSGAEKALVDGVAVASLMNDEFLLHALGWIRARGFNAYLLDQPQNLPFGNTREDILIVGPEYED